MQFHYVNYSPEELDEVRKIFIEYAEYLKIDLCFQHFEEELQSLSTVYATPKGCIILAKINQEIVGCVALKPIEDGVCEMKRLYVKPTARGHKVGRKLVEELISFAQKANYQTMKLDTLTSLTEAIALYRSFGFKETSAYVYNPLDEVLYFELTF